MVKYLELNQCCINFLLFILKIKIDKNFPSNKVNSIVA